MKKITAVLIFTLISLCFATSVDAQRIRFGIKGGVNFSKSNLKEIANTNFSESYTGFNAGVMLNLKLILGFSIQPELIYTQTGMKYIDATNPLFGDVTTTIIHGTIELPINIQWGIKLGPVRPYIQATPYIGYALRDKIDIAGSSFRIDGADKFQYGMGLGFGIDIWKFQIAYRYKWDLNSLDKDGLIEGLPIGDAKIQSSEITLGFFF